MSLSDRWRQQLDQLHKERTYRSLQLAAGHDLCSNDYLGYSRRTWSTSPLPRSGTASRLLRGHHVVWEEVEQKLADWHQVDATLIMNSGYAANEGLLSTILTTRDLVFSDQYLHASSIDGLRLSRVEKILFRHNDLDHLETLLRAKMPYRSAQQEWFLVTESLFGMEGDRAPLCELADLADRYHAHLIIDEAHATGCFGANGSGLVDLASLRHRVLATIHTGGKALAVPGAYIAGSLLLKEYLINRCRQLIFTTALPPQAGAWWLEVIPHVASDASTRDVLHQRAQYFRTELLARGISVRGNDYILSVILGEDAAAVMAAQSLQELGFDIRAIRPPTVPLGSARLRISLHADHEPAMLVKLAEVLSKVLSAVVPPS